MYTGQVKNFSEIAESKPEIKYTEEEVRQLFIDRAKEFSAPNKVFGYLLLKQDLDWFEEHKKK